jgi:hypothetical protein
MIELKGAEPDRADAVEAGARGQIYVFKQEGIDLKPGDEILVLIKRQPGQNREDYGVPLRITDLAEPGENDIVVQYGDSQFVAQKLPEFI